MRIQRRAKKEEWGMEAGAAWVQRRVYCGYYHDIGAGALRRMRAQLGLGEHQGNLAGCLRQTIMSGLGKYTMAQRILITLSLFNAEHDVISVCFFKSPLTDAYRSSNISLPNLGLPRYREKRHIYARLERPNST